MLLTVRIWSEDITIALGPSGKTKQPTRGLMLPTFVSSESSEPVMSISLLLKCPITPSIVLFLIFFGWSKMMMLPLRSRPEATTVAIMQDGATLLRHDVANFRVFQAIQARFDLVVRVPDGPIIRTSESEFILLVRHFVRVAYSV